MSLQEKHLYEINKAETKIGVMTIILITLLGALGFALPDSNKAMCSIRLVVDIITLVVFIITNIKYRNSEIFMYIGTGCLVVVFFALLFTTPNPYLYATMYPIILYVMFYQNKKFTKICALGSLVAIIIFFAKMIVLGNIYEAVTNFIIAASSIGLVYWIIALLDRHKRENNEELEAQNAAQSKLMNQLTEVSNTITEKINDADRISEDLSGKINRTAHAMAEINESTRMTAENVQSQTEMTLLNLLKKKLNPLL